MWTAARTRTAAGFATLVLVAVPFVLVTFPPATDLPQHLAQIRLLRETLAGAPEYRVNWWAPNNLVYLVLAGVGAILEPLRAGRLGLMVLALAWTGSLAWLAARRGRPWEAAVVAGTLIFQAALYWGFLNFLIGWPVFVIWVAMTAEPTASARPFRHGALLAIVAFALYASHVLWLGMAILWIVTVGLVTRPSRSVWASRLLALLAPGALAAYWYDSLSAARATFDVAPRWFVRPWARLSPPRLLDTTLGGLHGPLEIVVGALLFTWIALAIVGARCKRGPRSDTRLLLAAGLLGAFALLAPDKYMNTVSFASRWTPAAVALVLLAVPVLPLPAFVRGAVAFGVLMLLSVGTAKAWRSFERTELSGLSAAIAAAPLAKRVLGLDVIRESRFVEGRPFMQMSAYIQALRGGTTNFSFAEHGSGIVSYREPRNITWTVGLEWYAERFRLDDLKDFDLVLLNAEAAIQKQFGTVAPVDPITVDGRWRLYRVRR